MRTSHNLGGTILVPVYAPIQESAYHRHVPARARWLVTSHKGGQVAGDSLLRAALRNF